ncbi:hypothetical protein PVAND_010123 [Polypedilum vanderplanki]|uniref:Uncharacterized protein n=1 Tax=Polypedilum vanderplanki TaxID=319348 RepID=A0A9J6CFA9_POLVA|nr:hypothetical protein PVAND_010123 [Polypedilum vanderplanki]
MRIIVLNFLMKNNSEKKFQKDWNNPCITVLNEWLIQPDVLQASEASTSKRGPGRPSKEFTDIGNQQNMPLQ